MTAPEELAIIKKIRAGDDQAFTILYRETAARLRTSINYMLNGRSSEVEDILQETFIKVYQKLHLFQGDSRFFTWVYRIALNIVRMRYRAGKSERLYRVETDEETFQVLLESREVVARQFSDVEARELHEFIAELPNRYRQVTRLHLISGYSQEEVGKILGVTIGAVKAYTHRARKMIGAAMSNRRKKKNRLRADKLNAARAREVLGTPRPGQTLPRRGGGSDASFKEVDLGHYMNISKPPEVTPRYTETKNVQVHNPVRIQDRTQHRPGEVRQFSPEAIAHMNYLHHKGEKPSMDQSQKTGGVELALEDAREKMRFYQKQAIEAEREHTRWRQVVESLEKTMELITGRAPLPVTPGTTAVTRTGDKPRGYWAEFVRQTLSAGPMTRAELKTRMKNDGGSDQAVYQAIRIMEEKHKITMTPNGFVWGSESDFDSATEGASA